MFEITSEIKNYIIAAVTAVLLVLGVYLYIDHLKIKRIEAENKANAAALVVSNASVKTATDALNKVNKELTDAQTAEQQKQAEVHEKIVYVQQKNKSIDAVKQSLQKNIGKTKTAPTSIPKDISDAWKKL